MAQELRRTHSVTALERRKIAQEFRGAMWGAVRTLIVFAAAAVLVSTLWFPMFVVQGDSMAPTLKEGDILLFTTIGNPKTGNLVAFSYNNQDLIKRVIAVSGQWVDISPAGSVSVNGKTLNEPYVSQLSLGECDIDFPFQVSDRRFFVLGDNRVASLDSRSGLMGTVHREQVKGKALLRLWPVSRLGLVR